jgi:hypothetical protein
MMPLFEPEGRGMFVHAVVLFVLIVGAVPTPAS